jgi:hypothetical protein
MERNETMFLQDNIECSLSQGAVRVPGIPSATIFGFPKVKQGPPTFEGVMALPDKDFVKLTALELVEMGRGWPGIQQHKVAARHHTLTISTPDPEPSNVVRLQPAGDDAYRASLDQIGREEQRPPRIIRPTFWIPRDPTKIPRRQCLYGKHYYRKYVSITVAPGGRGKTSLVLVANVAMAIGRPLLGVPVPKRLRVWYWNGEDPQEEIDRRVAAMCLHFGIDQKELAEWLCTDNGRDTPICIADQNGGKIIFGPDTQVLTKALIDNARDVLTLDPFIKAHGVSENDNGAIDRVARQFAAIANEANSSIELPCHVRKASSSGRVP